MKEVKTRKLRSFELGTQEGVNVSICVTIRFQQEDRQDSQNFNTDSFYRPPVTSIQWIMGTEKYPDSTISMKYHDDDYS